MAQNREPFLSRWSRRKRAAKQPSAKPNSPAQGATPPPELPPVDSLTPESDFSAFMHEQVDDKLRRAALRKLFSDPALNVMDGLDEYAEDFNQLETLAAGAAAGLEHAKRTLFGEAERDAPAPAEGAPESDERTETALREAGAAPEGEAGDATRDEAAPAADTNQEKKA